MGPLAPPSLQPPRPRTRRRARVRSRLVRPRCNRPRHRNRPPHRSRRRSLPRRRARPWARHRSRLRRRSPHRNRRRNPFRRRNRPRNRSRRPNRPLATRTPRHPHRSRHPRRALPRPCRPRRTGTPDPRLSKPLHLDAMPRRPRLRAAERARPRVRPLHARLRRTRAVDRPRRSPVPERTGHRMTPCRTCPDSPAGSATI